MCVWAVKMPLRVDASAWQRWWWGSESRKWASLEQRTRQQGLAGESLAVGLPLPHVHSFLTPPSASPQLLSEQGEDQAALDVLKRALQLEPTTKVGPQKHSRILGKWFQSFGCVCVLDDVIKGSPAWTMAAWSVPPADS